MNPEFWGPSGWKFLHSITFYYPKQPTSEDKMRYGDFFRLLQYTLPCERCAHHYGQNLKKYSLEKGLESRENLIKWLIDIHNDVNKDNKKRIYTYQEVIDMYKSEMNEINGILSILTFVQILIVIIIFYLFAKGILQINYRL